MEPIRILVVDDNPLFLDIATDFLRQYDELSIAGTATGGQEALIQVQELQPQIVLLDLAMPDLPGLEVIPRLRQMLPEIGIIVVTMLDVTSYREAVLAAGANDLVPKIRMNSDLLPAIRRLSCLA